MGTATISLACDGAGASGFSALDFTSQMVNVSGNAQRLTSANVIGAVQFGNVNVGDVVGSQGVTVRNGARGTLTDTLLGSISAVPGRTS